ncbi:MAG: UDP-N-acetylmuramate dehydrogenase [Bacteroidota bacterium]|nr:UDP-N-acetylmuramate dehydrogenase [Bacteroidota bacterium]
MTSVQLPAVRERVSLAPYNTFGINISAAHFIEVTSKAHVLALCADKRLSAMSRLVLGGGSNILFTQDFDGLVVLNRLKGLEIISETDEFAIIRAGSGEVWHELVKYSLDKGLNGIENLSLIPGTVGAAPIQNIGAYGVELKEVFHSLEAIDLQSCSPISFVAADCRFGYRDSIFKREGKGRYFITSVSLKLSKVPKLDLSYGAIVKTLSEMGISSPDASAVSEAVCRIRRSKLPDPAVLGNAGSFFKNPEIPAAQYQMLKEINTAIPGYAVEGGNIKVPAGWLIEQCGWKGKKVGNTGAHKDQALVLVNYGNASGNEVAALSAEIRRSVLQKFGIPIEPEVNIL